MSRTRWLAPWSLALVCFALAAGTGALLRFAMYQGAPFGLALGDIRHAHSHLMFFSWATPPLMLFAGLALAARGRRLPAATALAVSAAVCGLIAYLPFLLSGYGYLPLFGRELPLSMMASGLNGLPWYAFALCWLLGSWRLKRDLSLRLMDGAVLMLLVASAGAALLAQAGVSGTLTPDRMAAFVDLFLTAFADGWFGVGLLAALTLVLEAPAGARTTQGAGAQLGTVAWLLAGGLAVRSLARLFQDAYAVSGIGWLVALSGAVAAAAWLWLVIALWSRLEEAAANGRLGEGAPGDAQALWLARASLALLGLKAVVELALTTPAADAWVTSQGLHVLLLHAFLLGAVSLGIVAAARLLLARHAFVPATWFALAVLVMVVALVPLTGLWPSALTGPWVLRAAAFTSLGPPAVAVLALASLLWRRGRPPEVTPAATSSRSSA